MLRRNKNRLKPFVSPTEEIDKINKLKIERELKEEENKSLILSLEENRKLLYKLISSFSKIEKEHQDKLEQASKEYLSVIKAIDLKNNELSTLNTLVNNLKEKEIKLSSVIITLEENKINLEDEINKKIKNLNLDKNNSEIYLSSLRDKIEIGNKEYNEISEKLSKAKEELRKTIEEINTENTVLAVRKKDIEIYENRLKTKYSGEKIIL